MDASFVSGPALLTAVLSPLVSGVGVDVGACAFDSLDEVEGATETGACFDVSAAVSGDAMNR